MSQKTGPRGADGFEQYYSALYGARWNGLREAFFREGRSVEYRVPGAEKPYFLDAASVYAASCLPLEGAQKILDLCAAPGGKTVVLASRMPPECELYANERSPERKRRLAATVRECLPEQMARRVTVSCSDGALWCRTQSECFDRILLDAPCSSERHVISDPKYLSQWSPARIKTVTTGQWALLSCAFRLLSPGGLLLYSTCAITPDENDGMIERLHKKFNRDGKAFLVETPGFPAMPLLSPVLPPPEKTGYGFQFLPDSHGGTGPMYFSLIRKTLALS